MTKFIKTLICLVFHGEKYTWGTWTVNTDPSNPSPYLDGEWYCTKCGREWND